MEKVRFTCPRCQTVMQTGNDRVGYDVACPHCSHRFKLIAPEADNSAADGERDSLGRSKTVGDVDVTVPFVGDHADSQPILPRGGSKTTEGAVDSFKIEEFDDRSNQKTSQSAYASPVEAPRVQPVVFCCPFCRTTNPPQFKSKVSNMGWAILTVLLLTTCIFGPIGLLVRKNYQVCSRCKITLGGN